MLMRRWRLPAFVAQEDVEQEMRVAACNAFKRFDPSKGTELSTFVLFSACDKAQKWLHQQRGASKQRSSCKSRIEVPVDFSISSTPQSLMTQASQEVEMDRRTIYRCAFLHTNSRSLRWGLMAMAHTGGDGLAAAYLLFSDQRTRERLRLDSPESAFPLIEKTKLHIETMAA